MALAECQPGRVFLMRPRDFEDCVHRSHGSAYVAVETTPGINSLANEVCRDATRKYSGAVIARRGMRTRQRAACARRPCTPRRELSPPKKPLERVYANQNP